MLSISKINPIINNKYNNSFVYSNKNINFGNETKDNTTPIVANNSSTVNFGEQNTKSVLSKFVSDINEFAKSLFTSQKDKATESNPPKLPVWYA